MEMHLALGILPGMASLPLRDQMLEALRRNGMSIAELARRSGVSYDVLNKLKRGDSQSTSAENAVKIAQALGLDLDGRQPLQRVENHEALPSDRSLVPVYDVAASAGFGMVNEYEPQTHSLAFPPDYLRRLTSSSPRHLAIISVKGDSMEPTLLDDDIVLLDTSKTNLGYDGLFVLRQDDVLHVKRISRSAQRGHVMVISDNPVFPPFEPRLDEVEAVGKVLWYGRKV